MSINYASFPNKRLYHTFYVLSISLMIAAGVVVVLLMIWAFNWKFSDYGYTGEVSYPYLPLKGSNFFIGYYPDVNEYSDWSTYGTTNALKAVWMFHMLYFLLPAAIMAGGILLRVYPCNTFLYYYRDIPSGRIVNMDTSGGGRTSLDYYMDVEGRTRAGERRLQRHFVSAKTFQVYNVGDHISFH